MVKLNADILIISDYPNEQDVVKKTKIVGFSNDLLLKTLSACGIESFHHTFLTLCRITNKDASKDSILCCKARLLSEIQEVSPKKILMLGENVSKTLLGESLSKIEGKYTTFNGIPTIATYSQRDLVQTPGTYRDFSKAIEKLTKEPKPYPFKDKYTVIQNLDHVVFNDKVLSIDIETLSTRASEGIIHSIGINRRGGTVRIIPFDLCSDTDSVKKFFETLISMGHTFLAYNSEFEYTWIKTKYGVELPIEDDPFFMHYAIDERSGRESDDRFVKGRHTLKTVVSKNYDCEDWSIDLENVFDLPDEYVYEYLCKDVEANWLALDYCTEKLTEEYGDNHPYFYKNLLVKGIPALSSLNTNKIFVDKKVLKEKVEEGEEKINLMRIELQDLSKPSINMDSPTQVSNFLFYDLGLQKVQGTSIGKNIISELALKYPDVEFLQKFSEYKKFAKFYSTYLKGILEKLGYNNYLYSEFGLTTTDTGRLSSYGFNLQNVIKDNDYRRIFIPPPGYLFMELDYSQLEFRVLAEECKDEKMINFILSGGDVHTYVASIIYGKDEKDVTKEERQKTKDRVFGKQYLESVQAVSEKLNISIDSAKRIIDIIDTEFPGMNNFINSTIDFVEENQYIESATGRRRRFPLIFSRNKKDCYRKAVNAPIQSKGSDINWGSLIRSYDEFKGDNNLRIIGPVHDSICSYVTEKNYMYYYNTMKNIMETSPIATIMKYNVTGGVGKSWGEIEEL